MTEGWKCPNCGKAHAPDVKTCPEPATARPLAPHVPVPSTHPMPTYPPVFIDPMPRTPTAPWPGAHPIVACQSGEPPQ